MHRRLHPLIATLVLLLTVSGGANTTRSPVTAPALAEEMVAAPAVGLDQTLRPWDPDAIVGSVVVLGAISGPPATPAAATPLAVLSADAVVARAQAAVQRAGTYRFALTVNGDPEPTESSADDPWGTLTWGAVDIDKGIRRQSRDGSEVAYYDNLLVYYRGPEGTWVVYPPGRGYDEPLLQFLNDDQAHQRAGMWQLQGTAVFDDRAAYILTPASNAEAHVEFWIDAATFLPLKLTTQRTEPPVETDIIFFDFGAPVDVRVPPEAVAAGFMQVLLPGYLDLETWHDLFTGTSEQTSVDVSPCRDVAYDVVTRPGAFTSVESAEVSVVFADPCIQTREGRDRVASDTMLITLEYREEQWSVQRVAVPH